ncbi:hypothetical protein HOK51_08290 [Candidatus Woesearchaeota archaeon]|nr:hypothetical protein [Candidatus Woesearchaeota archaeon]MBT6519824.1 hypothetical protein [Candidatus Woesearchaeota archaeon]MBT7368203.1 hypothetical protein [Candidatus Woesearchaeota archaeon]
MTKLNYEKIGTYALYGVGLGLAIGGFHGMYTAITNSSSDAWMAFMDCRNPWRMEGATTLVHSFMGGGIGLGAGGLAGLVTSMFEGKKTKK